MGRSGLDGHELQEALLTLASQLATGMSRYLELLADFDEAELYGPWECRSTAHWLNVRAGVNLRTAQEQVRVARALRALPRVREELSRGRLSYCKVRAITRVATEATEEL